MNDKNHLLPGNHATVPNGAVSRAAIPGAEETFSAAAAMANSQHRRSEAQGMKHPWVTAAAMFGAGAILGALAVRLFGHRPTLFELLGVEAQPRND
jgi:hypothetical protein